MIYKLIELEDGGVREVEGELGDAWLREHLPPDLEVRPRAPVTYRGQLMRVGRQVQCNLDVGVAWAGECVRCLKPLTLPVNLRIPAIFLPALQGYVDEESWTGEALEDENVFYYTVPEVDLSRPIREYLLLEMPAFPACPGGCEATGVDAAGAAGQAETPERPTDPRWAALKQFKVN